VLVSGPVIEVNRFEVFGEGVQVLRPLMSSHGFEFGGEYGHQYYSIVGRGEEVVRGEFSRGNRRLELEVWYSLGPVNYRIGDLWLTHESYLRALGVPAGLNAYPAFSDDPVEGFRHLKLDLENFASEFLAADAPVFIAAASQEATHRPTEERRQLAWMAGDVSARHRARELFHARMFDQVVSLLGNLKFPEFLDDYERKILDISRTKVE
jgi:hypothetical protein